MKDEAYRNEMTSLKLLSTPNFEHSKVKFSAVAVLLSHLPIELKQ